MCAKRRERGDGSIYQRGDGLYVAYARIGKGKRKYCYDKTRSGVQKKLKLLQKEIDARTLVTAKPETVEAYLQYWLSIRKGRKDLKESTHASDFDHLKPVYSHIGQVKLTKLTGDHLQKMFDALLEKRKASTVHTMHTILSSAFNDAIKWKRLSYNPCKDVQLPQPEKHEGPVLTGEQALHLLEIAQGHYLECFLVVALATGMRKGELLSLKWADVNFEEKALRVTSTYAQVHDETGTCRKMETTPKTKAGKRTIKLAQFAVNALKAHKIKQLEARLQAGQEWNDRGLVFCKANGEHLILTTLSRHFKMLLQGAELSDMRIHDLRHSAATLLLSKGVSMKVVQEILGHANFSTTANIYAHVIMEMQNEAMDKMDRIFLVSQ